MVLRHPAPIRLTVVSLLALVAACGTSVTAPSGPQFIAPQSRSIQVNGVLLDIAGAVVAGARVEAADAVAITDAAGAFQLSAVTISPATSFYLMLRVTKEGYHTLFWKAFLPEQGPGTVNVADLILRRAFLVLPIDGRISLTVSPEDSSDYVGTIYYSDWCFNCVRVYFTTPADADVRVNLEGGILRGQNWLQLWALDGAMSGVMNAGGSALTLPRGQYGTLIVGTPALGLDQSLPFTLSTTALR